MNGTSLENPVVQSLVRSLIVNWGYDTPPLQMNGTLLLSILQLTFCCLESFSITVENHSNWNDFSREMKDALSTIIHLPTLKTLNFAGMNVPIMLFQGVCLTKLMLHCVSPQFHLDGEQPWLLTWAASEGAATTTPHTAMVFR